MGLLAELGVPGCRVRLGAGVAAPAVILLAELGVPTCCARVACTSPRGWAVELLAELGVHATG